MAPTLEQKSSVEKKVLITGFGIFPPHNENPASLVLEHLPHSIPETETNPAIELLIQKPLPVVYEVVWNTLRNIWEGWTNTGRPDFVIHIGMHGERNFTVESIAHRDGYERIDADGKVLKGGTIQEWTDAGSPSRLESTVDVQKLVDLVMQQLNGTHNPKNDFDLLKSVDAGRYLCEFSYYCSLFGSWLIDNPGERPGVIFLHIPPSTSEEALTRDARVVETIVRILSNSF